MHVIYGILTYRFDVSEIRYEFKKQRKKVTTKFLQYALRQVGLFRE
jgi:hypothetical protein